MRRNVSQGAIRAYAEIEEIEAAQLVGAVLGGIAGVALGTAGANAAQCDAHPGGFLCGESGSGAGFALAGGLLGALGGAVLALKVIS